VWYNIGYAGFTMGRLRPQHEVIRRCKDRDHLTSRLGDPDKTRMICHSIMHVAYNCMYSTYFRHKHGMLFGTCCCSCRVNPTSTNEEVRKEYLTQPETFLEGFYAKSIMEG
jgi:hypothetical protein